MTEFLIFSFIFFQHKWITASERAIATIDLFFLSHNTDGDRCHASAEMNKVVLKVILGQDGVAYTKEFLFYSLPQSSPGSSRWRGRSMGKAFEASVQRTHSKLSG